MTVTGQQWAVRALAEWGRLSPFAGVEPAVSADVRSASSASVDVRSASSASVDVRSASSASADVRSASSASADVRSASSAQRSSARTADALLTTSMSSVPSAASPSPAAGNA